MADIDILFPLTLRKMVTQTFWGVGSLGFFCTIDINKKGAIF